MKRIVTIQDFSCVGRCSLTVALPIISAAGIEACAIPTAVLSNHTGFDTFYCKDLTEQLQPIGDGLKRENISFDAIYTGYIASARQMGLISDFIDRFRENDTVVFVDPVMGDNGKIYAGLSADYPRLMMQLCKKADIIAPNITEACMMTGREYHSDMPMEEIEQLLQTLFAECGVKYAVITGVKHGTDIGAVGWDGKQFSRCLMPHVELVCMGTGDIFASVLLAAVMRGAAYREALELAVRFTYESVRLTAQDEQRRFYGVNFEQALPVLIKELSV